MTESMPRHVTVDDWIFEVKMVRALRVDSYGKPYDAIANVIVNGDTAFVEGLMMREDEEFDREDYQTFLKVCKQLGAKFMQYERFKNDKQRTEVVEVERALKLAKVFKLVQ
jgi:hypothetical protein